MKGTLILICLVLFCNHALIAKNYHFEKISPNSGFTFNELSSIVQDQDGIIWFGSTNGLYRYNGYEIERFTTTSGNGGHILSNYINKLYIDDQQTLWVCTPKGFCTFNRQTNSYNPFILNHKDFSPGSPFNAQNILQVNDSTYLLLINFTLYRYNINKKNLVVQNLNDQTRYYRCQALRKDDEGQIWLGTTTGATYMSNNALQAFNFQFRHSAGGVSTFCFDGDYIWVGHDGTGIEKISKKTGAVIHYGKEKPAPYKLLSNRVRKIIKRENGDVWISTFLGINIITKDGMETIEADQFNNLPDNSVYELMIDHQNGIWIGTWAGGLAYYSDYNYHFEHIKKIPFDVNLAKNTISSFTEDKKGVIWIGSETSGLKTFDTKTRLFESFDIYNEHNELINVKQLAIDKNETIWMGTFADGVWYKEKNSTKFKPIENDILKKLQIIHKLYVSGNELWICSINSGVISFNIKTKEMKSYTVDPNNPTGILSNNVWTILIDSLQNVWIGTNQGVCVKMANSNTFKSLSARDESFQNIVYSLCEVRKGEIWAGTKDKGILKIEIKDLSVKPLDIEWNKSLPEIYNLISDDAKNIWINSDQGIQMYNPYTKQLQLFDETDGVLGKNFNPNACLKSSSGELYFGGSYGFNIIQPSTIIPNPYPPDVTLCELKINNLPFEKNTVPSANALYLPMLRELTLNHQQNTISASFIANNYVKASNNQFKYRLLNYQDEWTEMGTENNISFTKIPPGKYILEVLGSNNNGVWSTKPYKLNIYIIPPWWRTNVAYLLYFLIFGTISYLIIRELNYRAGIKKAMLKERYRHDAEEKLFQEKQKFFTNISHEFRTPLTLILSPIDVLNNRFKYDVTAHEHLNIIKRNADRLLRLTNEILDFRLIETGKIKLKSGSYDIIQICKNTYDCFTYAAIEKEINFIFSSKYETLNLTIDSNKIEKIIYNLLSNAFKFSAEKSQIILSIDSSKLTKDSYVQSFFTGEEFIGECIEIRVKDFGKGISQQDLPFIFDRFSTKTEQLTAGTGLGLHISQEYIRLHGGNIFVWSEENQETTFIVNIPLSQPIEVDKQSILIQPNIDNFRSKEKNMFDEVDEVSKMQSDIVVLLIEDHAELRKYLKTALSNRYKVLTASNGIQGYEIALEIVPNIIISDILMPGKDGITLTKQLKQHNKTNHIPIILLTALNETADQIHGISHGADSYLVKPVDINLLLAHINRLLEDRKMLAQRIGNSKPTNDTKSITAADKLSFIEKATIHVSQNLLNTQFSVTELSEKLNISRSSLHRKIKNDTNLSVTEFIRDIRMQKAIELMKEKKYNLDEIGYYVGFNSHSYFTRSFKKKYGKTPKEFYDDLKTEI